MSGGTGPYPPCRRCGFEPYGTPGAPCERKGCSGPAVDWWHDRGGIHWLVCEGHRQPGREGLIHDGRRAMSNPSKSIGTWTAEQVVRYLLPNGWPFAERRALHGNRDRGDITGTPGICWEVKGGKAAETCAPGDLATWQAQTLAETRNSRADVGVLICKRKGVGATRVGEWWAWLYLPQVECCTDCAPDLWLRVEVRDALTWLRSLGYGTALDGAA